MAVWTSWDDCAGEPGGPRELLAALSLLTTAPLAVRRLAPFHVLVVVAAAAVASTALSGAAPFASGFVPILIAVHSSAARSGGRSRAAALLLAPAGYTAVVALVPELRSAVEIGFGFGCGLRPAACGLRPAAWGLRPGASRGRPRAPHRRAPPPRGARGA